MVKGVLTPRSREKVMSFEKRKEGFYTRREVMRFCQVTKETLRFYEEAGLIHPFIDPKNQYRYYSNLDVETIEECRRYKAQGYSIKEMAFLRKEADLSSYRGEALKKAEEKRKEKEYAEALEAKHEEEAKALEELSSWGLFNFHEEILPETYIASCFENPYSYQDDPGLYLAFAKTPYEQIAFADFGALYSADTFFGEKPYYIGGFCFRKEWVVRWDVDISTAKKIDSVPSLACYLRTEEGVVPTAEMREKISEALDEHKCILIGDPFSKEVAHLADGRYLKFYFPYRKKE